MCKERKEQTRRGCSPNLMTQTEKAKALRELHRNTFLLPNAWDAASARIFEDTGFPAIGTTSAGIAFALGFRDGQRIPAEENVDTHRQVSGSTDVPVTADLEAGYGDAVENGRRVWDVGAVGINLEDVTGDEESSQIPLDEHVQTIRRLKNAVPELFVNARTDIFLMGIGERESRLPRTIERLNAFREAGADCLFAPGVRDPETIQAITAAVAGPVNILAAAGSPSVDEMRRLGVKRVSVGSGPMRACMGLTQRIAEELRNAGTYGLMTEGQYPYPAANELMNRL